MSSFNFMNIFMIMFFCHEIYGINSDSINFTSIETIPTINHKTDNPTEYSTDNIENHISHIKHQLNSKSENIDSNDNNSHENNSTNDDDDDDDDSSGSELPITNNMDSLETKNTVNNSLNNTRTIAIVGIVISSFGIILMIIATIYIFYKQKKNNRDELQMMLLPVDV